MDEIDQQWLSPDGKTKHPVVVQPRRLDVVLVPI